MAELLFVCLAFSVASSYSLLADGASVGINYGRVANNLPSPNQVAELIMEQGFTKVKLYDADPAVVGAFAGSAVELVVALPNERVRAAAVNKNAARGWVVSNVARHLPATKIVAIAVGNEIIGSTIPSVVALTPHLLPAMQNIHAVLSELELDDAIKISSPLSLAILSSSYPPSAGTFAPSIAIPVMKPLLDFLAQTNSYAMLNAYPFFAYESQPDVIPLDYAIFASQESVPDPKTGLSYTNLFDAQVDAFFAAMALLGHPTLDIVVTETGWPSKGDENEIGASPGNAAIYVSNLANHIKSNVGTPLRPRASIDTYIFALFNENEKPGPTSERNYGLFYPNMQSVYELDVPSAQSHAAAAAASKTPITSQVKQAPSSSSSPPPSSAQTPHGGHHHHHHPPSPAAGNVSASTWCVALPSANAAQLQNALDFACGQGRANCSLIQPGQACYSPNTLIQHASYAFNYYYQANKKAAGSCNFGGAATITTTNPSYQGCKYPSSL